MSDHPIIFEEKGHPTIKVFEDKISIKAVDYWDFRDFKFANMKSLELFRPHENSALGVLYAMTPIWKSYREKDDYVLRVKLRDGEHWDYNTTYRYSKAFKGLIQDIQNRLMSQK